MKKLLTLISIALVSSFAAIAGPHIDATVSSLSSFHYILGSGPSAAQTVQFYSGLMPLTAGNVTVTGAADYEISLDNISFGPSASIAYDHDTLAHTTIYIRLKAGLVAGNYNGEMVTATAMTYSKSVTVNGAVTNTCSITSGTITGTSASFTWAATGANSYECLVDQVPVAPAGAGTAVTTNAYTVNGLSPNSTYYLHVRGNCGNGNFTNWTNKVFSTASTRITELQRNAYQLNLSPVPNNGTFTLIGEANKMIPGNEPVQMEVVNIAGQVVYKTVILPVNGQFSRIIEMGSVKPGLYIVRVAVDGKYSVQDFTVSH